MKLAGVCIFLCCLFLSGIGYAGSVQQKPQVFVLDGAALVANKARIQNNDPKLVPAYQRLLKDADTALMFQPVSVMEKVNLPPSGDKHDYMSIAPYFWPDSSKPGGSPYMNRDGLINPEVQAYKDKIFLAAVCDAVSTLALAFYFSDDERYVKHAAKLMRVWFLDTATKMNPNLNYAQAIKGRATGRGYGLIDTRHFVKLVDAIGMLKGAKSWTTNDQAGMQQWFSEFLTWMETSKNGKDENNTANNHGVWYDLQRLSLALFTGKNELAKAIVKSAQLRLDKQMDDTGSFPLEMKRTISLHYTVFVLDPFFSIAAGATHTGVDFWNHTTGSGKSLRKGFNALAPYLLGEKSWTGPQILPFDFTQAIPVLLDGAKRFDCTRCASRVKQLLGASANTSRYLLTSGVSFYE